MNTTMRAVALLGTAYNISVIDVPKPVIQNSTDAIIRVTAAAICGSDLHFYHESMGSPEDPFLIGHEALGYISEVGDAVQSLETGQYVVIPDNVADGHFSYHPEGAHSFGDGALGGCQSEYVRVPYADDSLIPVPVNSTTNQTTVMDYLFVSDIFATGWTALDFAGFEPGDTVAIFGAGPVGLLSAYSAILRGASRVYSVDHVQERLDLASSIGAIPVNFNESDPVDQILATEPNGVQRSVDAVGYEAVNSTGQVDPGIIGHNQLRVTAQEGGVGIAGVYWAGGESMLSIGDLWTKSLTAEAGIVYPLDHATELVQLIANGRASPSFIVSSTIGIEEAPEYYRRFDNHEETKVVISFP